MTIASWLRRRGCARLRFAIEKANLVVELSRRKLERRRTASQVFSAEALEDSELELQAAILDLESARARSEDARAEFALITARLARRRIFAPIDGRVTMRYVDFGATVAAGQPILQLVPTSGRFVQFAAPADDIELYRLGTAVQVGVATGEPQTCATIERVSPTLDKGSRFVFMAARLSEDRLRGLPFGSAVRVEIAEVADCA